MSALKFHDQSVLHDPPNSYGDCFRTTIANLLQLPPSEVPHFLDGDPPMEVVYHHINDFLRPFGLAYLRLQLDLDMCAQLGITGLHYEGGGKTERGTDHSAMFRDREMLHDPHPSHAGFTKLDGEAGMLVALRPWEFVHTALPQPIENGGGET